MSKQISRCTHSGDRVVQTHCFGGPVSRNANPAAHGNICDTEECWTCGARREVNLNGRHVEVGPWGLSRRARIEAAKAAVASAPIPAPLVCGELEASVDDDGCVLLTGPHQDGDERTLPASWLDAAKRRRCVIAQLEREVQS